MEGTYAKKIKPPVRRRTALSKGAFRRRMRTILGACDLQGSTVSMAIVKADGSQTVRRLSVRDATRRRLKRSARAPYSIRMKIQGLRGILEGGRIIRRGVAWMVKPMIWVAGMKSLRVVKGSCAMDRIFSNSVGLRRAHLSGLEQNARAEGHHYEHRNPHQSQAEAYCPSQTGQARRVHEFCRKSSSGRVWRIGSTDRWPG
jgi:hypothetical protein